MVNLVDFLDGGRVLELLEGLFLHGDHYSVLAFKSGSHLPLSQSDSQLSLKTRSTYHFHGLHSVFDLEKVPAWGKDCNC